MLRGFQIGSKRKSKTLSHANTDGQLPTLDIDGIEGVTMRRKFSGSEEASNAPQNNPRKRSSAELSENVIDSTKNTHLMVSRTFSLPTERSPAVKKKPSDYNEEESSEPSKEKTENKIKRPSYITLTSDHYSPKSESDVESPAFKASGMFLFRNALELDEQEKFPLQESPADTPARNNKIPSTKSGNSLSKKVETPERERLTKSEKENYSEKILESVNLEDIDQYFSNISSSKSSTLDDDCFLSIDNSKFFCDSSNDKNLFQTPSSSISRTRSLSGNEGFSQPSTPTSSNPSVESRIGRFSLDDDDRTQDSSSIQKKNKTLTLGRYSILVEKDQKSFKRSLSEKHGKWSTKKHQRSESIKKKLLRKNKQSTKIKDSSFLKGFLKKNKEKPQRSHSDSSDKSTSPWHSRRPGGAQQGFDGGGGSAPTSPQTGTKLSKLPFWKRSTTKQGKNQLENSSESIPDKAPSPVRSISPGPPFGSPLHRNDLTLQGQLKKNQHQAQFLEDSCRDEELRKENSIKIRIQEAKGIPDKRGYFCVLLINGKEERETTIKQKDGICFWGEIFEIYNLKEVRRIGIRLHRDDNKRIGTAEFEPVPSIQNPKLDEWLKVTPEKSYKDKDKEDVAIRIRYTFQKVTILPLVEYKRFTKYLKEGSLTLCRKLESLLNAKAKEDFVTSLISVLQYNKKAVSFLNQLIISDVKQAGDNDKVLFRANSMATKAIEVYMRLVGERYLETTLQEPVSRIIKSTKDFEVDCTKLQGDSSPSLEERRSNLLEAVRLVWSSILKSPKYFPAEIQEVFFAVRETLRNNDSFNRLISASVFLRLLCPAVMTPHLFGLIKEYPEPAANRRLTLVAKTLQTLANFSTFKLKEDCMQFLNPFIENEAENCRKFLANISGPRPVEMNVETFQKDIYAGRHLALLHLQLKEVVTNTEVKTTDCEMRHLVTQLSHIDDCLDRFERQTTPRQYENLARIATPFVYRSPPIFRRSISESQSKNNIKPQRIDDSPLRNLDCNRTLQSGPARICWDTKDSPVNSFTSRKNAAPDLSTSDNYVLQSALSIHREGTSNINFNNNNNNNNIEPCNLNQREDNDCKENNGHYDHENNTELNNQSSHLMTSRTEVTNQMQEHHNVTSRPESRSAPAQRNKTREKSFST